MTCLHHSLVRVGPISNHSQATLDRDFTTITLFHLCSIFLLFSREPQQSLSLLGFF
ncbi:uncharacterized protein DS421_12g386840 [Arachis hypogaea]|nr:uncharacterized protein DS421_12g386840 [Arachis hypogaea]